MKREEKKPTFSHVEDGKLIVIADTLPEAWEQAVLTCWDGGLRKRTEYDKAGDPESRDVTAMIVIRDPQREPRIHKAYPGSLEYLEIYRQEVMLGIHDHWTNAKEGKWSYTYHQRLFAHDLFDDKGNKIVINQFDYIINKLTEAPHSRRAQATVWKPNVDPLVTDPACLQRAWATIVVNPITGEEEVLMNTHMRSNDAFKANFMNAWAFTDAQTYIAEGVSQRTGRNIGIGAFTFMIDSFHIYGSYFKDFEGFQNSISKRPNLEDRTWDSRSELVQEAFASARAQIQQQIDKGEAIVHPLKYRK